MYNESEKILKSLRNYIGKPNKTNCYLSYPQLKDMLEKDDNQIEFGQKCIYFFIDKEDYIELFFFANDMFDLLEERDFLHSILPSNKLAVISIITNVKENKKCEQIMGDLGFCLYKKYLRKKLQLNTIPPILKNESICYAELDDIDVIQKLIVETFDEISDQIPDREELERMVSNKQVFKYVPTNYLAGFLINERQGKKSYLRMLCIGEKYRGNGIGKSLLQEYINSEYENVKLFYLWVDSQNGKAIELYSRYGYISDGLEQYIFIRQRKRNSYTGQPR